MSTIVVVGAGIVGASVAYHLAGRGVPVTLVDRASLPASGVTGGSFAWIGDAGSNWPGGAADLRSFVLADYRRLEAELPPISVRRTGSLAWTDNSVQLRANVRPGRGQTWVDRDEIEELEPNLRRAPERAVYTPTDAGVDPVRITQTLVDAARTLGAHVVLGSAVDSLRVARGRVEGVRSSAGFHPASTVVLAAGTESGALCESIGIRLPVVASPAVLMRVATPPALVRTIVVSPAYEARELHDGQLLMTAPHDDQLSRPDLHRLADHTLQHLKSSFRGAASSRLIALQVAYRPIPVDGPLVGYVTPDRSLYVAVMHSAVSLAPTVGRLVAQELATGEPMAELERSRPCRSING